MGCKIESTSESRGKFGLAGDVMTMTLSAGSSVGAVLCDRKGDYRNAKPAAELSVKFQIKQSDDETRPDRPMLL